MAVTKLPLYPGTKARSALPPSQQAALNHTIASTLSQVLALPAEKRDTSASVNFIGSYAKDHVQRILGALIWEADSQRTSHLFKLSAVERTVHERTFRLAEKFAAKLDLQILIDLAAVYGPTNPKRFRALLLSVNNNTQLVQSIETEGVPAFTSLLSSNAQGLYGIRKISHVLSSFLQSAPPELVRPFARSTPFVLALATAYDAGLSTCVRSYGGIRPERLHSAGANSPLDDWERIFLETKVALIDSFHVLLRTLLKDVEELTAPSATLAARTEVAFETIFALLDVPSPHGSDTTTIPFLNQSLLADYQHTYGLSKIISEATRRADDPRTQLLESTLHSLDNSASPQDRPGALKLLLRSSGVQPGIDNLGKGPSRVDVKGKGKAVGAAPVVVEEDPALDAAVAQVLDILPDQRPDYVRFLLAHADYSFKGNAERLIEALFEGTAPSVEEYEGVVARFGGAGDGDAGTYMVQTTVPAQEDAFVFTKERKNVFDQEVMDVTQLRVGKKRDDAHTLLQDRAFIEQMKADILRRAEEVSDDEDEEADGTREGGIDVAFEDELDEGRLKVRDGEESEDGETGDEAGHDDEGLTPKKPETVLELAYIADAKVFDRDAQTRRSKARTDLRAQTGWSDEQIEGWRIMLERNPDKAKILQKHEFSGNRRGPFLPPTGRSFQPPRGGQGRGHGRGRGGGGRGRGRGALSHGGEGGSSGGGGQGEGGSARDRAWKDKNKASRGNHNRKRGHDKKMARAGGPS
ncbi:hypothetical protein BC835DRAFT_1405846 [Cytidiella melzeri]|nr:hypothetical protein BC835DRAFT_1405846 [Cytidiella melzeri]